MRPLHILAFLGLAAPAIGQDCFWTLRAGPGPTATASNAAAFHSGRGQVICVDYDGSPNLRTWALDGTAWVLLPGTGPTRRYWYETAYDSARNRLVLYGGFFSITGPYAMDTWEWDGTSWTQVATSGPGARANPGLVFDSVRNRTVLFGGGSSGEVWEWDGVAWSQHAAPGPGPRSGHGMAFDPARGRTVIYAGSNSQGQFNDVWEWDGSAWTQRPTSGPGQRSGVAMVYDTARARLVVAGGSSQLGPPILPGETWEFDNNALTWTMRSAGNGPTAPHPMAFDTVRARGIVAGGGTGTWEWNGAGNTTGPLITAQPASVQANPGESVQFSIAAAGTAPLVYQWRKSQQPLSNGGPISGATSPVLTISPVSFADSGAYDVVVANRCGSRESQGATLSVIGGPCYANCDGSAVLPVLNVNDFICFQNKFAAQDTYANCDTSTTPPILNVMDFICFQNRYAAGCP